MTRPPRPVTVAQNQWYRATLLRPVWAHVTVIFYLLSGAHTVISISGRGFGRKQKQFLLKNGEVVLVVENIAM